MEDNDALAAKMREEALAQSIEAYVQNAGKDLLVSSSAARQDVAQYANKLIADRKEALLKNMFGHLPAKDLRTIARLASTPSATPATSFKEVTVERKRGRPRKQPELGPTSNS